MKVKKMIEILNELDPTGEIEVTGWAGAILDLDRLPGYYDGPGHYFEESECYPKHMYIDYIHDKIVIQEISTKDHIWNKQGDYTGIVVIGDDDEKNNYLKRFKEESERYKQIKKDILLKKEKANDK